MMEPALLKEFLDEKADLYENPSFIVADPISIPHRFSLKEDVEISGFLAAIISWGQRVTIVKNAGKMMSLMGESPYDFVLHANASQLKKLDGFVHRTFNGTDFLQMVLALRKIYLEDGGLEAVFSNGESMYERIGFVHELFAAHFSEQRSIKHISKPFSGSSAKRLNMFVRWMVRDTKRGVDFGIWKRINPSELICPLDVHTGNVGRKLGLLERTQNDWLAAEELTDSLRKLDAGDPVKYDFALFGLGVFEKF